MTSKLVAQYQYHGIIADLLQVDQCGILRVCGYQLNLYHGDDESAAHTGYIIGTAQPGAAEVEKYVADYLKERNHDNQ